VQLVKTISTELGIATGWPDAPPHTPAAAPPPTPTPSPMAVARVSPPKAMMKPARRSSSDSSRSTNSPITEPLQIEAPAAAAPPAESAAPAFENRMLKHMRRNSTALMAGAEMKAAMEAEPAAPSPSPPACNVLHDHMEDEEFDNDVSDDGSEGFDEDDSSEDEGEEAPAKLAPPPVAAAPFENRMLKHMRRNSTALMAGAEMKQAAMALSTDNTAAAVSGFDADGSSDEEDEPEPAPAPAEEAPAFENRMLKHMRRNSTALMAGTEMKAAMEASSPRDSDPASPMAMMENADEEFDNDVSDDGSEGFDEDDSSEDEEAEAPAPLPVAETPPPAFENRMLKHMRRNSTALMAGAEMKAAIEAATPPGPSPNGSAGFDLDDSDDEEPAAAAAPPAESAAPAFENRMLKHMRRNSTALMAQPQMQAAMEGPRRNAHARGTQVGSR
jgi:hypothetical protein